MANTYSQIYLQVVFAVQDRQWNQMGSHLDIRHLRVGIRGDAHSWRQDAELLIANPPFRSPGRLMFHSAPLGLGSFSPVAGYKHFAPDGAPAIP